MKTPKATSLVAQNLAAFFKSCSAALKSFKTAVLTRFARWSDPKLAPYRPRRGAASDDFSPVPNDNPSAYTNSTNSLEKIEPKPGQGPVETPVHKFPDEIPVPHNTAEFLDLLRRTPRSVLSQRERHVIATIMSFPETHVSEIMLPQTAITYVDADEVLGPLTLDRLYRSGFQHFPVLDRDRRIIGLIHTTALNSLEVREASRALDIIDPKIYYLREDYTLSQALAAFLRTNCYFFLVIDRYERIVGILTYEALIDHLLGETPSDNFDRDSDRLAVAKRKF